MDGQESFKNWNCILECLWKVLEFLVQKIVRTLTSQNQNTLRTDYRSFCFERKFGMYCFLFSWLPIFQTCGNSDLVLKLKRKLFFPGFPSYIFCNFTLGNLNPLQFERLANSNTGCVCSLYVQLLRNQKFAQLKQPGSINPLNICWVLDSIHYKYWTLYCKSSLELSTKNEIKIKCVSLL